MSQRSTKAQEVALYEADTKRIRIEQAAPTLLAACEAIVEAVMEGGMANLHDEHIKLCWQAIHQSRTKATGGTQP